jgi:hypothetical protein
MNAASAEVSRLAPHITKEFALAAAAGAQKSKP